MAGKRRDKKRKVCRVSAFLYGTAILMWYLFGELEVWAEKDSKQYVEEFNRELKAGYQLIYGEWETTEFWGGGMSGWSLGYEYERLNEEDRDRIAIYPDRIVTDGKTEYGDICFLCTIVPERWVYSFIMPWEFLGDAETDLKSSGQDFYLLGLIKFEGSDEVFNFFLDNHIFVKDSNTLIIATMFGFYKAERVGRLKGEEMLEINENSISHQQRGERDIRADDYLDERYRYRLYRYRLVYGEWQIGDYIEKSGIGHRRDREEQIGKTIEFGMDFLKVDGERAEGDLYILCNLVPEEAMDVLREAEGKGAEREDLLKPETADFYTVTRVLTRPDNDQMQRLRRKIPGRGYRMYVKDSDTLVIETESGYYVLYRTGYIDGVEEDELWDYMGQI